MKFRFPLLLGAVGVIVAVSALPAAAAGSGGTTATFALDAGSLDISVAPTATLTDDASGTSSITGDLGLVRVTDARGGTTGWVATASSSTFVGAGTPHSTSVGVKYSALAVTGSTGVATFTPAANGTSIAGAGAAVMTATAVTGNNSASWHPTIEVLMPASALADTYGGTVTTSVA